MASTGVHEVVADNVVANVGYRPDISIFQELQVPRAGVCACVRTSGTRTRARVHPPSISPLRSHPAA
jgi:hypothetical protein